MKQNNVKKQKGPEYIETFLGSMCAWCGEPLGEDGPTYGLMVSTPRLNWSEFEDRFIGFPIAAQGKPTVIAYVPRKDSRVYQEGASLCFGFCSAKHGEEFQEAFELFLETAEELQGEMWEMVFPIKEEKA